MDGQIIVVIPLNSGCNWPLVFLSLVSAGVDFAGGNYTITMKKSSKTACTTIYITRDKKPESSEYFTVKLRESDQIKLGSLPEAIITIVDNEGTVVVTGTYD